MKPNPSTSLRHSLLLAQAMLNNTLRVGATERMEIYKDEPDA